MNDKLKSYSYTINDRSAAISDPTPTRAQLLSEAGFEPAEDYVLIARTSHGTKVISSDDVLDLNGASNEFFASQAGQTFEVTVNGHSIWWGENKIQIATLRRVGNVVDTDDLIWQRLDAPNQTLARHGEFELSGNGIEHLKTHARPQSPHEYHFFVAGVKYTTELEELTGAQIMAMIPDWDPANSLVLEAQGDEPDEMIRPTMTVKLKDRHGEAHFIIVPPATFGAP